MTDSLKAGISDEEIDALVSPLGMAPYSVLVGPHEIRKFARALLHRSQPVAAEQAEDSAMRKDAMRYRWLRDESAMHIEPAQTPTLNSGHGIKVKWQGSGVDHRYSPQTFLFGPSLDAAIDAAMSNREAGGS